MTIESKCRLFLLFKRFFVSNIFNTKWKRIFHSITLLSFVNNFNYSIILIFLNWIFREYHPLSVKLLRFCCHFWNVKLCGFWNQQIKNVKFQVINFYTTKVCPSRNLSSEQWAVSMNMHITFYKELNTKNDCKVVICTNRRRRCKQFHFRIAIMNIHVYYLCIKVFVMHMEFFHVLETYRTTVTYFNNDDKYAISTHLQWIFMWVVNSTAE